MVLARVEKVIKTMLSDTIMALCRNTLPYDAEFSVEGLIGITMDSKEIFLVNLNETVQKEGVLNIRKRDRNSRDSNAKEKSSQDSENDISCDDEGNSSSKRKRRRRRRRSKESDSLDSNDSDSDHNDDSSNMSGVFPAQPSNDEQETSAQGAVKRERKDSDDIVFVKEEPYVDNHASYSDTASQPMDSSHMFVGQNVSTSDIQLQELALQLSAGDMSSSGSQGQQGNVPPSSFPPLPPDGSQQDCQFGQSLSGNSTETLSRVGKSLEIPPVFWEINRMTKQSIHDLHSQDVTENISENVWKAGTPPECRQKDGQKLARQSRFSCGFCGKVFGNNKDLMYHTNSHTGEKPYECQICHKHFSDLRNMKRHQKTCKQRMDQAIASTHLTLS